MEGDDPLAWLLANYGETIRGDEDTPEDQVAIAISPCLAERIVACWNFCSGMSTEELICQAKKGRQAK